MNPKTGVVLSGVPSRAQPERNEVEGSRRFRATPPVVARDPSTALRPPFRLRSAQDDTALGGSSPRQQIPFCESLSMDGPFFENVALALRSIVKKLDSLHDPPADSRSLFHG